MRRSAPDMTFPGKMRQALRRARSRPAALGGPRELDEQRLLEESGVFDLEWYAMEAGREFADVEQAVAHYRSTGGAQRLSPHPLFNGTAKGDQPDLTPLGVYLSRGAWAESPHPGWDHEAYVRRHPTAADHPFGPLGHVAERLEGGQALDVLTHHGTRAVAWEELRPGWSAVAATWSRQRRLRRPPWTTELPDDHEIQESPPVGQTPETLVSVVIPTWNRSARVRAALSSLQAQTWSNWEALVVDDGSEDDTLAVVTELAQEDPRIRLFPRPHEGVCAARNTALAAARGGFVAFLDSDNVWQPEFLDTMVRVMEHKRLDAAYGTLRSDTAEGSRFRATQVDRDVLSVANHVDLNVLVVRRALMDQVGGFDVKLRRTVDYDLVIRLADVTDLVHVPVVGVLYDNDSEASDRITVRESIAWNDRVQLKHRIDWRAEQARERRPGTVSVILPVFQRPHLLLDQLSVVAEALAEREWEAVVVDGSGSRRTAGVAAAVVATDSRVTYERLPMRVSFAYAADVGFTHTRGGTLMFLEPGVIPTSEAVRALVSYADETDDPFLVQPVTVDGDGQVVTAGAVFGPGQTLPAPLLAASPVAALPSVDVLELPSPDGRTFIASAEAFALARGLDVLFDNELELADLGLRLRQLGRPVRLAVLPGARVVLHHRTWQGDRSAAGRGVFSERHGGSLPDTEPLWERLGRRPTTWLPVHGAPYAVHALMGEG